MKDSLILRDNLQDIKAISFCNSFLSKNSKKYLFGRNERTESIIKEIAVLGVIDEFTQEKEFCGIPIIKLEDIPNDALVVSTSIGKPLTSEKRLSQFQFKHIDYYSFYKYSKLNIENITYWDGMIEDILSNFNKYEKIHTLLEDDTSKNQFFNIINFRNSYNLDYMRGFSSIEHLQYFEDFLNLKDSEVFVDIGGYDGFTSEEFIKKYSKYKSIHFFEPEEEIMQIAKNRLKKFKNINYYQLGVSNIETVVKFEKNGVGSRIANCGSQEIKVVKLDDILKEIPTFIKMDIEGSESLAIDGAKEIIKKYQPKLAISIYHRKDDFWKIPEQIFAIRDDYNIYLRHYTEANAETIMYFIPRYFK
ncbi:FkbM family methyltransferase [Aliarcobacter cryaerophilus]|uniref:FkbM family methyltransferase n=1 Tax=Aliarcobacter cryaerophilus TaxID=28198 RepID=UPI003BB14230